MIKKKLKLLDLFSGIGGFSLGLESTGFFETIAFVEKDKFCQKVLKKNFNNIPIEEDIKNVKGSNYKADVITGGFPCQPFSVAGKRKGTDDDRYLWDETIRVVKECKPKWFIGENVEGIINIQDGMVLRQVQDDLETEGFKVQCLVIPASSIGAWHQRKRVWIIAYSDNNGLHRPKRNATIKSGNEPKDRLSIRDDKDVSNSESKRYTRHDFEQIKHEQKFGQLTGNDDEKIKTWWQTQSELCGVPNGVSYELDKDRANRIKSLGNSIVPLIARQLGLAIMKAELDETR
jgi:DNA (cytosine-5)-methyltransferase 1